MRSSEFWPEASWQQQVVWVGCGRLNVESITTNSLSLLPFGKQEEVFQQVQLIFNLACVENQTVIEYLTKEILTDYVWNLWPQY